MSGYNNFIKRMNAGGKTIREEQIENARRLLENSFADDPSYIAEGAEVWYSDRILHPRIYDYKWKSTTPFEATIQTMIHEPIFLGDVIHWNKDNGYWMCVGVHNLHHIQWEGTLHYCNFYVKFYSPKDHTLREYPISMQNATQYGTGERYEDMMTIGSEAQILYISCDEHTVLLDNGFRFMLDKNRVLPTVYRITQVDSTSYSSGKENGFLRLYVLEDQYNPKTDDAENGIADAWEDKVGSGSDLVDRPDIWI